MFRNNRAAPMEIVLYLHAVSVNRADLSIRADARRSPALERNLSARSWATKVRAPPSHRSPSSADRPMSGIGGSMSGVRGSASGVRGSMSGVRGSMSGVRGSVRGVRGCVCGGRRSVSGVCGSVSGGRPMSSCAVRGTRHRMLRIPAGTAGCRGMGGSVCGARWSTRMLSVRSWRVLVLRDHEGGDKHDDRQPNIIPQGSSMYRFHSDS
jgi:hypothetical protein